MHGCLKQFHFVDWDCHSCFHYIIKSTSPSWYPSSTRQVSVLTQGSSSRALARLVMNAIYEINSAELHIKVWRTLRWRRETNSQTFPACIALAFISGDVPSVRVLPFKILTNRFYGVFFCKYDRDFIEYLERNKTISFKCQFLLKGESIFKGE